jgi:hypothetical protein
MMALDKMWGRNPHEVHRLLGDDVVKSLQDWQAKLRYETAESLALQLKTRDDPGVAKQRQLHEQKGRELARGVTFDQLLGKLDPSMFVRGPTTPEVDADRGRTRDAAMADYEHLFAERYAVTGDKTLADEQAVDRMKLYWKRSDVNGGRLTLRAPEDHYPQVNGSWDWMQDQLRRELSSKIGKLPDSYTVIADRVTEGDVGNGKRPSYLISVKQADGTWDIVRHENGKPWRYFWEPEGYIESQRDRFERQRTAFMQRPRLSRSSSDPWSGENRSAIPVPIPGRNP